MRGGYKIFQEIFVGCDILKKSYLFWREYSKYFRSLRRSKFTKLLL